MFQDHVATGLLTLQESQINLGIRFCKMLTSSKSVADLKSEENSDIGHHSSLEVSLTKRRPVEVIAEDEPCAFPPSAVTAPSQTCVPRPILEVY